MKHLILSLLLSSLAGCASKPKTSPHVDAFLKLNDSHAAKHAACTEQNKEVFSLAITERTNPENGDVEFLFDRDEKKALAFMSKVDLKKLTMRENELEYDALINDCEQSSVERPVCDTIWPSMKYYKGLLHAVEHYKWKPQTKKYALDQIRQYVSFIGASRPALINLHIGVDLMRQLSIQGHAPVAIEGEADVLKKEMDSLNSGMKVERRKAAGKSSECKQLLELHKIERQAIDRFSEMLLGLLRK